MTVVAWRNYPKIQGKGWKRRFKPLRGWEQGLFGKRFIRVSGRRHPEVRRFTRLNPKWWEVRRKREKRINWLALSGTNSLDRKRYAMRKAGQVSPRGWTPYSVRR